MIERSLAPSGHESTPETNDLEHVGSIVSRALEPVAGYVLRGLGIFELRGGEILASYQGAGRWMVPSGTAADKVYEVRVGSRPARNTCECRGWASHKHCSHVVAAHREA